MNLFLVKKKKKNWLEKGVWCIQKLLHIVKQKVTAFRETNLYFKIKCLAMINKNRSLFQYNSRDLVYINSALTIQLRTS